MSVSSEASLSSPAARRWASRTRTLAGVRSTCSRPSRRARVEGRFGDRQRRADGGRRGDLVVLHAAVGEALVLDHGGGRGPVVEPLAPEHGAAAVLGEDLDAVVAPRSDDEEVARERVLAEGVGDEPCESVEAAGAGRTARRRGGCGMTPR